MVVRITKILSACTLLFLLAAVTQTQACDWFSGSSSSASAEKKADVQPTYVAASTTSKTEGSVFDKIGTGTKNFFNKTGETLGLKKSEPKKYQYATANPRVNSSKKESKSWLPSFLKSDEKKPKTVNEWLKQPRQDFR